MRGVGTPAAALRHSEQALTALLTAITQRAHIEEYFMLLLHIRKYFKEAINTELNKYCFFFFWCYISCDREAVLLESWMEIKILKKGTMWDIQIHGKDEKRILWPLSGNKCHQWWLSYVCVRLPFGWLQYPHCCHGLQLCPGESE